MTLDFLSNREIDILYRRFKGETLKSIAQYYNLSTERIRQIRTKAFRKIGNPKKFQERRMKLRRLHQTYPDFVRWIAARAFK